MSRSATFMKPRRRLSPPRAALGAVVLGTAAVAVPLLGGGPDGLQRFHSRPDLRPPQVEVRHGRAAGRGYVFVAPKNGSGPGGPMILDRRGRLVWFHPLPKGIQAFDFKAERFEGRPVLTWWQGHSAKGTGTGTDVIYDSSYRLIARVPTSPGYRADLHEFALTGRRTALIIVNHPVPHDLRSVGGPRHGHVIEDLIRAIDVRSGRVVWQWNSLDHVGLAESYKKWSDNPHKPYDYFHLNSIRVEPGGRVLISARHTNAVYEIDRQSGSVRWRLGGRRSTFAMGPGTRFVAQHDARRGPGGTISLFDNQAPPSTGRQSRVIVVRIDRRRRTARLVHDYRHRTAVRSDSQGGAQFLPNGNVLVGWGGKSPWFSEYAPGGRLLFDARFAPHGANSYRAFLQPWRGRPLTRPAVAARRRGRGARVWTSWNGATEVASWEVLAGPAPASLRRVATAPRRGFETGVGIAGRPRWVAVRALDRSGRVLRASRATRVR